MATGAPITRGRNVLVSSDDQALFERTARLLEDVTFVVSRTTAVDLRSRLSRRRAAEVCLVIVDSRDGQEGKVFDTLRKKGKVPILALGDAARMTRSRTSGASSFLCLPLEDDVLLYEVARLTGQEIHG